MCILITGASGFIGKNLINFFKKNKIKCFSLDLKDSQINHDISKSLLKNKYLKKLNPKIIIHLAALSRIKTCLKNIGKTFDVNITGTKNILEYALVKKAKVIFASSYTCHGDISINPYTLSKFIGEKICEYYKNEYNLKICIARFFNVYGENQDKVGERASLIGIFENNKVNNLQFKIYGNGLNKNNFIHINDLCVAIKKICKIKFKCDIFNLGHSESYSLKEITKIFKTKNVIYLNKSKHDVDIKKINFKKTYKKLKWKPKINLKNYISNFLKKIK